MASNAFADQSSSNLKEISAFAPLTVTAEEASYETKLKEQLILSAKMAVSKVSDCFLHFIESNYKKTFLESARLNLEALKTELILNMPIIENRTLEFVKKSNYNASERDIINFVFDIFTKLIQFM